MPTIVNLLNQFASFCWQIDYLLVSIMVHKYFDK